MDNEYFPEATAAQILWIVAPPILVIIGTFGNVLSFVVLNRRHRIRTSTSTYLSALSICDLFVLYIGLLRQWIRKAFDFDIRASNDNVCKVHFYLLNFTLHFSSWILVAITIERAISVWKPHVAKVECTRHLAVIVLLVEAIVLMVLNGHFLFGVKIRIVTTGDKNGTHPNNSVSTCDPTTMNESYTSFMYYIWTWIDFTVVFFLPLLILMACNIVIITNIKRSRRFQREVLNQTTRMTLNTSQKPLIPLTAMLLTLNSVFFVCVGPITVFSIGQFHWWAYDVSGHTVAVQRLLWAVVNIMMYINNAVNFLLYIMCGSAFRAEVKGLLLMCSGNQWQPSSPFLPAQNSTRLLPFEMSSP